ncbi:MAG: hypothetical protein M3203_03575 [Actinomycetota bacterium]|nr:hypothetical protein [Actinomycetota bacterium]
MVSDHDRRELYQALEERLGHGPAGTLMELLPPVGWADVARQSDLVAVRGEMAELRAELKGEMAGLRGEMAELRAELKGEVAGLKGEMGAVRGELARLNARIDAQLPKFVWANVPLVVGVAGLVLAAGKLV